MARIKLDLPDAFAFSTELSVRTGDVNYGRHLGNDALLSLLNEARVRFLGKHGFTETDAGGAGLIMSDVVIVYKARAFHGDRLVIEMAVSDVGKHGCDFMYMVTHKESGKEVARAKTGIIFFDYSLNKVARVPEKFAGLFAGSPVWSGRNGPEGCARKSLIHNT